MKLPIAFAFTLLILSPIRAKSEASTPSPTEKPRLIVEIVVGQMRFDYITRYWDKLGENGFKRLVLNGTTCQNARYNYLLTQSLPGIATLATGCNPSTHGIVSDKWYSSYTGKETDAVADERCNTVGGSFFSGRFSPQNLITSTLGDELLMCSPKSKVVSIALDPGSAILMAGHSATDVYWLDTEKGRFVSSSYYTDSLPAWVDTFNLKGFAELYARREWKTLNPIFSYNEADTANIKSKEGKSKIKAKLEKLLNGAIRKPEPKANYKRLTETPYGNLLVKDFAIASVMNNELGRDNHTDLLCITFSAIRAIGQQYGPHSIEIEDAILRLDKELAHFLKFLDHSVGTDNLLLILTSDRGIGSLPEYLEQQKIPAGYFDPYKATILLGSYLNATYGSGEWITGYHQKQLYLNHRLIEEKKLNLSEVQQKVADFILEFNGVANSITASALQSGNFSKGIFEKFRNSYNARRSGDVIINLEPGWVERNGTKTSGNSPYDYDTHVPLILYGWKIGRRVIYREVHLNDLAPTLSTLIGITWPNGSMGTPIRELIKLE